MRILFFVEPVVFRENPLFLSPHVSTWVVDTAVAHRAAGFAWALASSAPLCSLAADSAPWIKTYTIDSWHILSPFQFDRAQYARALFDPNAGLDGLAGRGDLSVLIQSLLRIRADFRPDLIIATAQNSALAAVFADTRVLWIEQAPLPRSAGTARIAFDPAGHQVGSLLEAGIDSLFSMTMDASTLAEAEAAWTQMARPPDHHAAHAEVVRKVIRQVAGDRPVALMVLQPSDWLTWDGAGPRGQPEAVLAHWAEQLPAGWLGIPVHHPDARMSRAIEVSVANSFPQIALLPESLGSGVAEFALPEVDAIITVSSSVAMTAILAGKKVVVTGRTPYINLSSSDPSLLDGIKPCTMMERMSILAFLTHRYTKTLEEVQNTSGSFLNYIDEITRSQDASSWMLDRNEWIPSRISALI